MKLLANHEIKHFFNSLLLVLLSFFLLSEALVWFLYGTLSWLILVLFLFLTAAILTVCFLYCRQHHQLMEQAVSQIEAYLDGDTSARIDCDHEGEMYHLFHKINTLASVLNAHADNELREKEFLKNTISDISHQLKTPLAALNIYNGLLQEEAENLPEIQEFTTLSEQELDRIETLVQNLLKITRLDAGAILFEKSEESILELMKDIELHYAFRAQQEQKKLLFQGDSAAVLYCDRDWMIEAVSNLVKNAFDHTKAGDHISITWKRTASIVQIQIADTGSGIHIEDLHHIFKRFYRSRYSQDTQGIGLGLPLTKAIVEAHNGTIEVDSQLNHGTTFLLSFLIPTKL